MLMRVAILSDFHIGYERFSEDAYKQAEEALEKAASLADVLIIPGDIFDMRNPKPEVLAQGINLFRNIAKRKWNARVTSYLGSKRIYTDVPIIAIPGTHERKARDMEDPVQLLSLAGLVINGSDSTVEVDNGTDRIAIFSLGGLSEEKVKETLNLLNPQPVKDIFNIFMFHQSVYELLPFSKDFIHFDDLPKGFDLYVDGHIHNRYESKVYGKPFLVPGSTVLTQLKDGEQEQKGFYIFDTNTKKYEYVNINSRKFVVKKVKVDGKDISKINADVVEVIEDTIKRIETKPIIRIVLEGELKQGYKQVDIDILALIKKYEGKAIIEISKGNVEDKESQMEIDAIRKGAFENMSIKDYGMSIFLEKLKATNYSLSKNPAELFEALSSDQKKEKIISDMMSELFKD